MAITNFLGVGTLIKRVYNTQAASTQLTRSFWGKHYWTNSFLYFQQAICQGPIYRVWDVIVDENKFLTDSSLGTARFNVAGTAKKLKAAMRIDVHNGAIPTADAIMKANFHDRGTATFDKIAYASVVTHLDRLNPQFSAVPVLQFLLEGKLVSNIIRTGTPGNYSYSLDTPGYSNNSALVLLDYLMDNTSGKGVKLTDIDLESFYNAAVVCDKPVQKDEFGVPQNVLVSGNIWQPATGERFIRYRPLTLYECNIVLDPDREIRENIEAILSTMGDARLIWSQGKYKLSLYYPEDQAELDALVVGELTDADIVADKDVELKFPNASERFNNVTVKYSNEAENFKDDSVSWPPKLSETPEEVEFLQGYGAITYPSATGGWEVEKINDNKYLLSNYGVWDGSGFSSTVDYLIIIPKELIINGGSSFTIEVVADDQILDFKLRNYDYLTNAIGSIIVSGTKSDSKILTFNITLGNISEDTVYYLTISASDGSGTRPEDKGGQIKGRGMAARIFRGTEVIWTTRYPTYTAVQKKIVNNYLYRGNDVDPLHPTYGFKGFLAQDNGVELETEVFADGITDYYHALAKAEEICRISRGAFKLKLSYRVRDRIFEPGDLIKINSETLQIGDLTTIYCRVDNVKASDNFVLDLELTRFDLSFLAWNNKDDEYTPPPVVFNTEIPPVAYVLFYNGSIEPPYNYVGKLVWKAVDYDGLSEYVIYMHVQSYEADERGFPIFKEIGTTQNEFFLIPPTTATYAIFGVAVRGRDGRESDIAYVNMELDLINDRYVVSAVPLNTAFLDENGNFNWINVEPVVNQLPGEYTTFPTEADLGVLWAQNTTAIIGGILHILTDLGNGLTWMPYDPSGLLYFLIIESSNGTLFRVGEAEVTTLTPRLFKNGAEITEQLMPEWVRWRRVSRIPQAFPNDDESWDNAHLSGYSALTVTIDEIDSQATFFCDIIPITPFDVFWNPAQITASEQTSVATSTGGAAPVSIDFEWIGAHDGLVFIRNGNAVTVYQGEFSTLPGNNLEEISNVSETLSSVLGRAEAPIETLNTSETLSSVLDRAEAPIETLNTSDIFTYVLTKNISEVTTISAIEPSTDLVVG